MNKISDAEDILADARDYVECVWMAADRLQPAEGGPRMAVADMASKKIDGALALLEECSTAGDGGPVSAAPSTKPGSRLTRTKRRGK
jgi:hypothetical protein